ncbi:MAG: hypothetical protein H6923_03865 [Alphaproteobacteria bacterium]|nr:hypothetical protein [Alphaproteobacteria bacterium]
MVAKVTEIRCASGSSDIVIELRALKALPMEGVMTTLGQQVVTPQARVDPSVVRWSLPATGERYLVYGIVTPATKLLFSPRYERSIIRDGALFPSRSPNPEVLQTRRISDGEWVGPVELIRIAMI